MALSSTSIATALVEQGNACALAYDVSGAIRSYKAAIAADPNHRAAYICLGSMLLQVGNTAHAVIVFGKAAERWPDWILPWWAAAVARIPQSYRDASGIACVRVDYVAALREMRARAANDIADAAEALGEFPPFQVPYQGHDDRLVQTVYGGLVTGVMGATYPRWSGRVHRPWRPGEPLRVGIVCGAFRRHSGWRLPLRGWVENLDCERFSLFGYHTDSRQDPETELAASLFDRFVQGPLRLDDWARCIEADAPHA